MPRVAQIQARVYPAPLLSGSARFNLNQSWTRKSLPPFDVASELSQSLPSLPVTISPIRLTHSGNKPTEHLQSLHSLHNLPDDIDARTGRSSVNPEATWVLRLYYYLTALSLIASE